MPGLCQDDDRGIRERHNLLEGFIAAAPSCSWWFGWKLDPLDLAVEALRCRALLATEDVGAKITNKQKSWMLSQLPIKGQLSTVASMKNLNKIDCR